MPLYEYLCDQCHRHVEKIQSYSAPPLEVCPHCGGHLERTISAPAVQFKGSGWYVSDYGKGGAKPSGDAKPESGNADVSAAAATESKPAEAAPKKESAAAAVDGASSSSTPSS